MATGVQRDSRLALKADDAGYLILWYYGFIVIVAWGCLKRLYPQVLDVVIGPFGCPLGLRRLVREPRVVGALGAGALVLSVASAEGWHVAGK